MSLYQAVADALDIAEEKRPPERFDPSDLSAVKQILDHCAERLSVAEDGRQALEPDWAVCIAFERGNAWYEWSEEYQALIDIRDENDRRSYRSVNLITPIIGRNTSRITSQRPDINTIPKDRRRQLDLDAASEISIVNEHYDHKNDGRSQLRRLARYAQIVTTGFLLQYWDPRARATVPVEWDEDGRPVKFDERFVGDLVERVVPGHEIFADPGAMTWDTCRWLIHAAPLSPSEIRERWNVDVKGEGQTESPRGVLGMLGRLASMATGLLKNRPVREGPTVVYTLYQLPDPSIGAPKGRVICWTGPHLLEVADECEEFPFLPLGWLEDDSTPYHRALVPDLVGPQYDYNWVRSRINGILRDQRTTVVREYGDGAGADLAEHLEDGPRIRQIFHRKGRAAPQITMPPGPSEAMYRQLDLIRGEISDISGVHDVSRGAGDSNATSGYAIRLLLDQDASLQAPFAQAVETFIARRAERRARIVARYVLEPRVWGLEAANNPTDEGITVSDLPALRAGGLAVVRVMEGSATPRTPEATDAQIKEWYDGGLFGPPGTPEAADVYFRLVSSPVAARARQILDEIAAAAPPVAPPALTAPPTP